MAINPDIRDQAYQFFLEEAPELLQMLEAGLLTLSQERSTSKIHDLMRAAHSIKGGAASVGLEAIATLAHRLENIFKALYSDTIEIDTDLESQLLRVYDCLWLPLREEVTVGHFDAEQAVARAEPLFEQIEARLGDALHQKHNYIPSSADLGIDMVASIMEVDVTEGLERLAAVVAEPQAYEVGGELRAQAEVFAGFAELLELPGFGAIAETAQQALAINPERALEITQVALMDFERSRQIILAGAGQTTNAPTTYPSATLVELANLTEVMPTSPMEMVIGSGSDKLEPLQDLADNLSLTEASVTESGETIAESDSAAGLEILQDLIDTMSLADASATDAMEIIPESDPEAGLGTLQDLMDHQMSSGEVSTTDAVAIIPASDPESDPESDAESDNAAGLEILQDLIDNISLTEASATDAVATISESNAESEVGSDTETGLEILQDLVDNIPLTETSTTEPVEIITESETEPDTPAEWVSQDLVGDIPLLENIFSAPSITEAMTDDSFVAGEVADEITTLESAGIEENLAIAIDDDDANRPAITSKADIDDQDCPVTIDVDLGLNLNQQTDAPESLEEAVQSITEIFGDLPSLQDPSAPISPEVSPLDAIPTEPLEDPQATSLVLSSPNQPQSLQVSPSAELFRPISDQPESEFYIQQDSPPVATNLSIRVDSDRLERMNNVVGELAINRDGLSLQNEQLQNSVRGLLSRFSRFQNMVGHIQKLSDQMIAAPERYSYGVGNGAEAPERGLGSTTAQHPWGTGHQEETFSRLSPPLSPPGASTITAEFDSLEMDSYGALHLQVQGILEDLVQLKESVDDIALFARQSDQKLGQQRHMLTQLRDELIWARMLPLGEILNRFPRILRDLSTNYHKPVNLKITGTGVLVDKAVLEKLYDPLLHLLRNAFDHGIESAELRSQTGKPKTGQIEIRAYHQGNQTIIEVKDDGQGLNVDHIRRRALELTGVSAAQLAKVPDSQLYELIFEPGFSTALQVSELSGRGIGLDLVRSQLKSIKGTVKVTSWPGQGTIFTLSLPLTLTIAKLIIFLVGSTPLAIPADSVEEILTPQKGQTKQSGLQRFLYWREQIIPTYRLSDLLSYRCPLPETPPSKALVAFPTPKNWALPMLILRQEQRVFALEVDRLVTEQELVIKPFGNAIASPGYTYGCTILGDGSLVPVIDGAALLNHTNSKQTASPPSHRAESPTDMPDISRPVALPPSQPPTIIRTQVPTILVVDDAVALRRTLALSLERAGFRVLQARDGQEAITQLQKTSSVQLVVCDIEMPNMNGFEFLTQRRQDPKLAKIPVVMLTSRSNDKHRWLAMQLDANGYFTKPYLEQEFILALRQLISQAEPIDVTAVR
ncbi:MAG: response regulator [Cyanothece sp. SIO1E1]|nr:response regulator [Cyanothece sp. SIO1E1]